MAKGDVKFITMIGAVGRPATNFTTKEVIPGLYRHQQGDVSFKCGLLQITGKVKLVADEYEGIEFFRMEGLINNASQIKLIQDLAEVEW